MFVYGILLHCFVAIWGLFIGFIYHGGFMWVFHEGFSLLKSLLLCIKGWWELLREFYEIICLLDQSSYTLWVWELSNLSLGSSNQCLLHRSTIGDMIFFYCIDMCWSSFFCFLTSFIWFPIISLLLFIPFFRPIPTPMHIPDLTAFFTSFTWSIDGLITSSLFSFHQRYFHRLLLSSHAHEILLCVVHYT